MSIFIVDPEGNTRIETNPWQATRSRPVEHNHIKIKPNGIETNDKFDDVLFKIFEPFIEVIVFLDNIFKAIRRNGIINCKSKIVVKISNFLLGFAIYFGIVFFVANSLPEDRYPTFVAVLFTLPIWFIIVVVLGLLEK